MMLKTLQVTPSGTAAAASPPPCIPDSFVEDSPNATDSTFDARNMHKNLENSLGITSDLEAVASTTTTRSRALPGQFVLQPKGSNISIRTAGFLLENHHSSIMPQLTQPSEQEESSSRCHHDHHASNDNDDDDDTDKEVEFFSLLQPLQRQQHGLYSPPRTPPTLLPLIPQESLSGPHTMSRRPHNHHQQQQQHSTNNLSCTSTFLPTFRPRSLPRDLTEMF